MRLSAITQLPKLLGMILDREVPSDLLGDSGTTPVRDAQDAVMSKRWRWPVGDIAPIASGPGRQAAPGGRLCDRRLGNGFAR